jgi:hypothetical protein
MHSSAVHVGSSPVPKQSSETVPSGINEDRGIEYLAFSCLYLHTMHMQIIRLK